MSGSGPMDLWDRYRPEGLARPARLGSILGLVALLAVSACDQPGEELPRSNQAPHVRITGGPLNGSRQSYTARIFWSGYDSDGVVSHYEYALDPPEHVFTPEEIAHPEHFPGVTIERILGPEEDRDTLRVAKMLDGVLHTFDWVQTNEFSRTFAFRTPNADSSAQGGHIAPDPYYSGIHSVYVRAQDNEGTYSEFDRIAYTAETQTPRTEITRPAIAVEILPVGPRLTIVFEGLDPDSPEADKRPVGFLTKLLRLDALEPPIPINVISSPRILYTHGDPEWIYQSADTSEITLFLATPGQYLFGVRAVDQAGAVEPFLDWGRNAFKFQALPGGGRPTLVITEPALGRFPRNENTSFRGAGQVEEAEVPVGQKLRFRWSASAEAYGGKIEAFSWGMDIPDLDREGPNSGWSGWGAITGNFDPIVFTRSGVHALYVRARDESGTITLGIIVLQVVDFTFDRELLIVDDSFDRTYPRDGEHDEFWRTMVTGYSGFPPDKVHEFAAHGAGDLATVVPQTPTLEELGRYKTILWECRGSGYNGQSALLKLTAIRPVLGSYLSAGGKLWLGGRATVAATIVGGNGLSADLTYPKDLNAIPRSFAYHFLKLHTSKLDNDKGANPKHSILQVTPYNEDDPIYETMDVDLTKLHPVTAQLGGPSQAEAVFDPIFAEQEPGFEGDVDSLYAYGAAGPLAQGRLSTYHTRLVAIRWHDPDPDREHGRIQWFGFPMYFFENTQAQETFNRSMDWFREELPPGIEP